MFWLIDLIIGLGCEIGIRSRMLGIDGGAEVRDVCVSYKCTCIRNVRLDVDEFAHSCPDFLVEIE